MSFVKKHKGFLFMLSDFILLALSFLLGLYFRFNGNIPWELNKEWFRFIVLFIGIKLIIYYLAQLYHILWKFAGMRDLWRIIIANVAASVLVFGLNRFLVTGIPRSIFSIIFILDTLFIGGSRLLFRTISGAKNPFSGPIRRTMIIGAGEAGNMVVEELRRHQSLGMYPVLFVDDDPTKQHKTVNGVPVLGNRYDIPHLVEQYDIKQIIYALPSAKNEERLAILKLANQTKAKIQLVPGLYELIDGKVDINNLREVEVEDLLGRNTVEFDNRYLKDFIENKVVMVTGAGGSIGSELARQIAKYRPKQLILLDIYENNVYDVQIELTRRHPELNLKVLIESIRDEKRIDRVMNRYRPEILFHAAAHKHVPLMEDNPFSAVLNNVFGTRNVIDAAGKYGVKKFVQISTDKAVNPTNVMGCTKRICEKMIQSANGKMETDYVAVRFGNVLGSNGSVIPLFKKQIAQGGPVTVTDERIIRYFMTIPEACQLVLIAGSMAKGGEIFVLDMGEPVKIMELAKNLIKLSGKELGKDIEIKIVGLRPGEKLYEEILLDKETMEETMNNKIFVEKPEVLHGEVLENQLKSLKEFLSQEDEEILIQKLREIVPEYHPNR
ncbi:putative epimerase/dehydratase WbiI [Peptostreptococcaceae bacterium oral taxon 113 str. W5053]|nr:putative epimerase/dehydratase WbiI [Peptostreptococcaceae bacterium oral taxon 113 str. W5053]